MQEKIRKEILYFLNNSGKHTSYNDIWNYVNSKMESINENEFNKELASLAKQNLIISHLSVNKEKRYEAEVKRHYHFICQKCGTVKDVFMEQGAVNMVADHAQKLAHSYAKIDKVNMSFQGVCHQCRR